VAPVKGKEWKNVEGGERVRWVRLGDRQGLWISERNFQKALDIDVAILSVRPSARPSVMFPHIVLKRFNIIYYHSAYGSAIIIHFPVLSWTVGRGR